LVGIELTAAIADQVAAASAARAAGETIGEAATDIRAASGSLREAGGEMEATAATQRRLTEGLNMAQVQLTIAATETGAAARVYAATIPDAVDRWNKAAIDFDAGVREHFIRAAKSHGEAATQSVAAAQDMAKALGSLEETVASLDSTAVELSNSTANYATAGRAFHDSIRTEVMPAHQSLGRAVNQLEGSAERLTTFIEKGVGPATEKLASLGALVQQVQGSTAALQTLSGLREPIAALGEQLDAIRKTAEEFEALAGLRGDVEALLEALGRVREVSDTIDAIPKRFGKVLNDLTDEALRRQSATLQETLVHLLRQAGEIHARGGHVAA
jgi:hypothetical protein